MYINKLYVWLFIVWLPVMIILTEYTNRRNTMSAYDQGYEDSQDVSNCILKNKSPLIVCTEGIGLIRYSWLPDSVYYFMEELEIRTRYY